MNFLLALALMFTFPAGDAKTVSSNWQQYLDPAQAGWSSEKLASAASFAEEIGSAALMVVYRGRVLLARGYVDGRYGCHSVRKSLLSSLYGVYVDAGLVDLDKTLAELGIDDLQGLSPAEKQATVRDMIKARSGVYHPASKEPEDMSADRPERGSHPPGTHFWYNNWDFNTSGVILEKQAGIKIFEAFAEKLAAPLGMEDFRLKDGFYQYERTKSVHPAHAFRLSARDLARVGQLFLQEGVWHGKQILSKSWIEESTASYSKVGRNLGYAYMWWVYEPGYFPNHPELSAYAAQGTGGQAVYVFPQLELVFVHRGDTDHQRHVRGRDLNKLLGMVLDARIGEPRENPELVAMKAEPFAGALPPLVNRTAIVLPRSVLETYAGTYQIESGPRVMVRPLEDFLICSMEGEGVADFFPESKDLFFSNVLNITVEFGRDETGAVTSVDVDMFGQKVQAKKVE